MRVINLHLSTKLWLSVSAIVLAMVTVIVILSIRANAIQAAGYASVQQAAERARLAQEWIELSELNAERAKVLILSTEAQTSAEVGHEIEAADKHLDAVVAQLRRGVLSKAESDGLDQVFAARARTVDIRIQLFKLKSEGQIQQALELLRTGYAEVVRPYLSELGAYAQRQVEKFKTAQTEMEAARVSNVRVLISAIFTVLLGMVVGAFFLIRSINAPLQEAVNLAAAIAQGDLSQHIHVRREDEFGTLLNSLTDMNTSLGKIVGQVRMSIDSIATASSEIATGNNDLATRTEQSAGQLQSTASAMDHLTTGVQHSAAGAAQANALANVAHTVAQQGGAVMQGMVQTMEEINGSSRRINDIIAVIDGIAFQTNILALNAAVEAARAGEQGRGFAVVAGEVRTLAGRSAEAAREIKTLIQASVGRVEAGTDLVAQAGSSMGDILKSVNRVSEVVAEISVAAKEQSEGLAEVNQAIAMVDQMTQQNAALVEQSAAAALSLKQQAAELAQAIAVFRI